MRALVGLVALLALPSAGALLPPVEHTVLVVGAGAYAAFVPHVLVVRAGDPVVWRVEDLRDYAHTATEDDRAFDTGPVASGTTSAPVTLPPGTYTYGCLFHATMRNAVLQVV